MSGDLTKNFSRKEFACQCGCGFDTVDYGLVVTLQALADKFEGFLGKDISILVTSGCRCRNHNTNIGGSANSQHTLGRAADFKVFVKGTKEQVDPDVVADTLEKIFPESCGIGRYSNRTHFDTRSNGPARWDVR